MVLMKRDGVSKWVPDVFVNAYRSEGYVIDGEREQVRPVHALVTENPSSIAKEPEHVADEHESVIPTEEEPEVVVANNVTATGFVCPHCGKEYTRKAYLDKHIGEKHAE